MRAQASPRIFDAATRASEIAHRINLSDAEGVDATLSFNYRSNNSLLISTNERHWNPLVSQRSIIDVNELDWKAVSAFESYRATRLRSSPPLLFLLLYFSLSLSLSLSLFRVSPISANSSGRRSPSIRDPPIIRQCTYATGALNFMNGI